MKKIFTLTIAILTTLAVFAWDYECVEWDGLYYNLDETNQIAEVTYKSYDKKNEVYNRNWNIEEANIPSILDFGDIVFRVCRIGQYAFRGCNKLRKVTISNETTKVGYGAFWCCTALTSITMSQSIDTLDGWSFYCCSNLTSIEIPSSIKSIGEDAFYRTENINEIHYGGTIDEWCTKTWSPSQISKNYNLYIGDAKIENFIFPNNIPTIADELLYGCSSLISITIPNTVNAIGKSAFYKCSNLSSIEIPHNVTLIGEEAFVGCNNLRTVTLNARSIVEQEYSANSNIGTIFGEQVEDYIIGDNITSIGDYAFYNCYMNLYSVTLSTNLVNIGHCAFKDCYNLMTIMLPDKVTHIGNGAFAGCYNLTSFEIPRNVVSIGDLVFYECENLSLLKLLPNVPPSIGVDIIGKSIPIYIPCGSLGSYKSTAWNQYNIQYTPSQYSITVSVDNNKRGTASVDSINSCYSIVSATSKYGYHFDQWSDEVTDNPRKVILYQDTTIIATFAPNIYSITAVESPWGEVEGQGMYEYLDTCVLTAISHYGYHFSNWKDYSLDNPRKIEVTSDWIFEPVFAPNRYSLQVSCNAKYGVIDGESNIFDYLSEHTYTAVPNYGYHFTQWSDGNTDNPRTIILTNDTAFEAFFDPNIYTVSGECDPAKGSIAGLGDYIYLTEQMIEAIPNYGYHFVQWSDGIKENPRYFRVKQDTVFTAEFDPNIYTIIGECEQTHGYIIGSGEYEYLSQIQLQAYSKYGYNFDHWADGVTDNPRIIQVAQDSVITAVFKPIQLTVSVACDEEHGSIEGEGGTFDYASVRLFTAVPIYGYHFANWHVTSYIDTANTLRASEAYVMASQLEKGHFVGPYYIRGYITGKYGTYSNSYYMADTPDGKGKFVIFQAKRSAQVGDHVIVNGSIYNYQGTTPETKAGALLYIVNDTDANLMESETYVTTNPYSFTMDANSALYASFERNQYGLAVKSANPNQGTVKGNGIYLYQSEDTIQALPYFGYHFTRWSDGITDNPRVVVLTCDTTFTAEFAANPRITFAESPYGHIEGDTTTAADILADNIVLTAVPEYGYHFTQWTDGNTDNPRTIFLSRDTTFAAEYAVDKSGTCGLENRLIWVYDAKTQTLTISGNGQLSENFTYGVEAPEQMHNLTIGNDITEIGARAFYGMTTINHLIIGGGVTSIGNYAFAECKNFDDITCYATTVPTIKSNTFANVGNKQYIYLFVPEGRQRAYLRDAYWGEFDVQVKNAETVTEPIEIVVVIPSDNTVEISWPIVDGAESYEISITKDGETVCTLIFNANGQLTGIAFAPARDNANKRQTEGFKFTVTGLTCATQYGYSIEAKNANNQTVDTKSGSFTTTGDVIMGIDQITNDQLPITNKVIKDGRLFILRGEKIYTLQGQQVR